MVVVKIMGGFGNQLFQYATGRALALHLNTELKLDFDFFDTDEKRKVMRLQPFNLPCSIATEKDKIGIKNKEKPILLKKILNKLNLKISPFHKPSHIIEDEVFEIYKTKNVDQNFYIEGWLGDERYFKKIYQLLLNELNVPFLEGSDNAKLKTQIDSVNSIAVHVRRGDYLKNTYFKTLPTEYYLEAITKLKAKIESPHFFFFSDDMNWVKSNFKNIENAHFIENNNKKDTQWSTTGDIEDLMLIKTCKHQIIANSTYSWWGAWLNSNPNKIILYPEKWFNNQEAQHTFETNKFIPSDWIKIKF